MKTTVSTSQVILLAEGDTSGAQSNARGHLFEEFIAQLMALFGYEKPTRADLNNTSNGIELDVSSAHTLTKQPMIAECKAYSSSVEAKELNAFYGKLGSERFDHPDVFGYFVAVPGLTKNGRELQMKLESKDARFRGYDANGILRLLLERSVIQPLADVVAHVGAPIGPLSDDALLVTKHGLYYAAYELAPDTRLPRAVLVYPTISSAPVPTVVIELLTKTATYARGLPCADGLSAGSSKRFPLGLSAHEDTVIEVTGSSSDFEYQYPAAPKYFIGRQHILTDARALLERPLTQSDTRAKVLVLNAQSGWGKSSLALRIIELARAAGGAGVCIDCRTATKPTFVLLGRVRGHSSAHAGEGGRWALSAERARADPPSGPATKLSTETNARRVPSYNGGGRAE